MNRDVVEALRQDGVLKQDWAALEDLPERAVDPSSDADEEDDDAAAGKKAWPAHLELLRLCNVGALEGGLSIALDVRADELIGSLCALVGGSARKVKILDVRDRDRGLEVRIQYGEVEEPWDLEDLYALVHNLNDLLKDDRAARWIAVLGEWEDMLQLWCVRKADLPKLLRRTYFAPRNRPPEGR